MIHNTYYLHGCIHWIGSKPKKGGVFLEKFQGCLIFEFYYFFMWKIKNFFRIYSRSQGSQTQTQVPRGVCPPSPSPNLTYAWIIQQTYHRTDEKKKDCLYFQEFLRIFIVIISLNQWNLILPASHFSHFSFLKIRSSNLVFVLIWYWEIKNTNCNQVKSESSKYKKCSNRSPLDTTCNQFFNNWRVVMPCTVTALVFLWQTKGFYD